MLSHSNLSAGSLLSHHPLQSYLVPQVVVAVKSCPVLSLGRKLHVSFCKAENLLSTPQAFSLPGGSGGGPEGGLESAGVTVNTRMKALSVGVIPGFEFSGV